MSQTKRNIIDRRKSPFVMVTRKVIEDKRLKASDKSLYTALCLYADNETQECFPSRKTLWETAGISDNTFRNSLSKLESLGYITVKERWGNDGRRLSNLYVLLDV